MKTITYDETTWKLVPIEETPEMRMAGLDDWQYGDKSISSIWRDMLEAAPKMEVKP